MNLTSHHSWVCIALLSWAWQTRWRVSGQWNMATVILWFMKFVHGKCSILGMLEYPLLGHPLSQNPLAQLRHPSLRDTYSCGQPQWAAPAELPTQHQPSTLWTNRLRHSTQVGLQMTLTFQLSPDHNRPRCLRTWMSLVSPQNHQTNNTLF